jgi:hypothetical protein
MIMGVIASKSIAESATAKHEEKDSAQWEVYDYLKCSADVNMNS